MLMHGTRQHEAIGMEPAWITEHFNQEYDDDPAVKRFPWRDMSPEEWVARHGHSIGCFSYHRYRYRNQELGVWMCRVGELLTGGVTQAELEAHRRKYLTPIEYAKITKQIADIKKYGL